MQASPGLVKEEGREGMSDCDRMAILVQKDWRPECCVGDECQGNGFYEEQLDNSEAIWRVYKNCQQCPFLKKVKGDK